MTFTPFPKIPRLFKDCTITEKVDGTNAVVMVSEAGAVQAGSRNRPLTVDNDNFGFAKWVSDNADELRELGPGLHYGEWAGPGIQKRYKGFMDRKRFYLFNSIRWAEDRPACCDVVPVISTGEFNQMMIDNAMHALATYGSIVAPHCMNPEGVMIYHHAASQYFKVTYNAKAA